MKTLLQEVGLDESKIYTKRELAENGFRFGSLMSERDIKMTVVAAKKESIVKAHGIIVPTMLVPALSCIEQGLKAYDADGKTEITSETPDIEHLLIGVDGHHRNKAAEALAASGKVYDIPCMFPQVDDVKVLDIIQEANVATYPWKGTDFLKRLVAEGKSSDKIDFFQRLQSEHKLSEATAWIYTSMKDEKAPSKKKYMSATKDEKVCKELNDGDLWHEGQQILDSLLSSTMPSPLTRKKVVAQFLVRQYTRLRDTGKGLDKSEATQKVCKFLKSLTEDDTKRLVEKPADDTSRDTAIENILKDLAVKYGL